MSGPLLSNASAAPTHEVGAADERGRRSTMSIPAERAITVYVDQRELVTLTARQLATVAAPALLGPLLYGAGLAQ
jgi:hypothetical protein